MALMDVFTHFSIIRRERRGIRPEEIKQGKTLSIEEKLILVEPLTSSIREEYNLMQT
jgi:hypothetical protein